MVYSDFLSVIKAQLIDHSYTQLALSSSELIKMPITMPATAE
jgi:hypothetical protein